MSLSLENHLRLLSAHPVIDPSYLYSEYLAIDLSIDNDDLILVNTSTPEGIQSYITKYLDANKAKVAYGGYLEQRSIYQRSSYFKRENLDEERNIHLGLDFWVDANTSVHAPLDGEVHSFNNNINFGDYGPTIILQHCLEGVSFYTLYGHLSLDALVGIEVGQKITKGQEIATLGDELINGNYAPHLHFQIIKAVKGFKGDYPGVSSKKDLEFYKANCPDPNFLLDIGK